MPEITKTTLVKLYDNIFSKLKKLGVKFTSYDKRTEGIVKLLAENIKKTSKEEIKKQLEKTLAQSKARTVVNDVWKDLLK